VYKVYEILGGQHSCVETFLNLQEEADQAWLVGEPLFEEHGQPGEALADV